MARWSTVPFVLIILLILPAACGGKETVSLPPTQPALLTPTATAEPVVTGPAFVDDLSAGIGAAETVEIERQSRQLLAALDAGGYVAGEANLRREYSPEAGLMFVEIVGGTIGQVDANGQVVATYAPGTRVMESRIPGNDGELLFFSPDGVNTVRAVAGLPPINPEDMVFRLTAEGIPYVTDARGGVISRVMTTSNPDVAPWMPEEILAVAPNARVIRPMTEGTSGPMGAYDETGQTLLAQQDEDGNWVAYSAVVEVVQVLPEWDFEVHGKLPSLTQDNASIEVVDGTIELTFRVDNERSRLNGQEFTLTIPENQGPLGDGKFLTLTGEMADTTLVVDPMRESAQRGLEFVPGIKRVTADGTILAQYDTVAGIWRNTYETIEEGLGQQEVKSWMPQELGFLGDHPSGLTAFVGRPDRLLYWNIFAPNNSYAKQG
jgi:hypothetical protein